MACCQHRKQPEKKQTSKLPFGCCNNDMPNPFVQYACCVGFIPQQQNTGVAILSSSITFVFINTGVLIPNYCSGCWRPPELTA